MLRISPERLSWRSVEGLQLCTKPERSIEKAVNHEVVDHLNRRKQPVITRIDNIKFPFSTIRGTLIPNMASVLLYFQIYVVFSPHPRPENKVCVAFTATIIITYINFPLNAFGQLISNLIYVFLFLSCGMICPTSVRLKSLAGQSCLRSYNNM